MINQITIEGCLIGNANIIDSKTRKDICFVNFKIRSNKSYLRNGNWENKPYSFEVCYSTEKINPILTKLVKGSHVLINGYLAEEQYKKKSIIKIKCNEVGILPVFKNIFSTQKNVNKNIKYNNYSKETNNFKEL